MVGFDYKSLSVISQYCIWDIADFYPTNFPVPKFSKYQEDAQSNE